jgi:hypothetical protein
MQAAVRTILAGRANDICFAVRQPTVRRRADSAFLATQVSWRLFCGPYLWIVVVLRCRETQSLLRCGTMGGTEEQHDLAR